MAAGMRIATLCPPATSNGRYRAILPLRELERRGHTVLWPGHSFYRALENVGAPKWDVLWVQQFFDEDAARAAWQGVRVTRH
jgi:hypothetical protein